MKIINIWFFSNIILQTWTGHKWHLIISCLDPQKAFGTDDINHRMVIASEHSICPPLCKLFNLSLRKIWFPSFWKLAYVTAVFKKSDKSITSNYRPISLFSCVSRIFERTVFKYVLISRHKYIHKLQSGFITGYSTSHQLVEIYHCIMTTFENLKIRLLWHWRFAM